jgi:chromosome segregation ATPase
MIDDVEAAIQQGSRKEEQAAIEAKRKEVMQVEAESDQRQKNADTANKHVKQATLNLNDIKAQVDELSARKLADLVSLVNEGADIGELSKDIEAAEKEYQELQDQFDDLKAAQKASIEQMEALLNKDNADLDKLSQTKQNLSDEVDQLLKISETLPEWCTSS